MYNKVCILNHLYRVCQAKSAVKSPEKSTTKQIVFRHAAQTR